MISHLFIFDVSIIKSLNNYNLLSIIAKTVDSAGPLLTVMEILFVGHFDTGNTDSLGIFVLFGWHQWRTQSFIIFVELHVSGFLTAK